MPFTVIKSDNEAFFAAQHPILPRPFIAIPCRIAMLTSWHGAIVGQMPLRLLREEVFAGIF